MCTHGRYFRTNREVRPYTYPGTSGTAVCILNLVLNLVLYFWPRQNRCMASARCARAGFRKFQQTCFLHASSRARAAYARVWQFTRVPLGRWNILALCANRKQKYQNGNIHRKLKVPTSEREGTLSTPRARSARAMQGENFRKFTETRARPPRARHALIFCWS